MKPFSMRRILKDTCNKNSFQRKRKQSLCKMNRAPKKPLLKPFQEEQQPPMGRRRWREVTEGMESPFLSSNPPWQPEVERRGRGFGKNLWWLLFFETNMERTEQRDCSIIYNLHIQLKHWQKRFCRQRKNKTTTKRTCKHPEADQTDVRITSPTGLK